MADVTRGSIRAAHTPGGNVTIDTTHTIRGLIRTLDGSRRPHIEIERADIDDAIAALCALRGDAVPPFELRGTFRIYFNRAGAAPLVWCVATDKWELAVAAVSIRTAAGTRYQPKATPDNEDGKPSAWIVATGVLTLNGSEAVITGASEPEAATP